MAEARRLSQKGGWLLADGGKPRRALLWALGACVALTALYALAAAIAPGDEDLFRAGGIDVPPADAAYQLVLLAAAGLCLARVVLWEQDRLAWGLLTLGMFGWVGGELTFQFGGAQLAYPSLADVLYLSDYPLTIAGLLLLLKGQVEPGDPRRWLDGLIAGLAVASLAVALLAPALEGLIVTDTAKALTNLSYPVLDVLLVSFVFAAIGAAGRSLDRSLVLLLAAFALSAVADATYLYLDATSSYVNGSLLDVLWMISATLVGFAAWTRPEPSLARRLPIVALVAPVLLALGAVVTALAMDDPGSSIAIYLAMATMAALVGRLILALLDNERLLRLSHSEAHTDALTGLANRRRLNEDLSALALEVVYGDAEALLAVYDLDGFKSYNDSFGHAAGDDLLRRVGANLSAAVGSRAQAYRLGGDEFCVIVRRGETGRMESVIAAGSAALVERGRGFAITSSVGVCHLPADTTDPSDALRLADSRMYASKGNRGGAPVQQAGDLLMQVLRERQPDLGWHSSSVSELAGELARASGLSGEQLELAVRCAELHDVGKMAIPDEILDKPGPLSEQEWALMRKHTLIGERILTVSPSLTEVARLVRSTHERWDGGGYPDGLAGEEIPLGSRITVICDAFESITAERPYDAARSVEEAIAELRRGAGTQFDPALVETFCAIVAGRSRSV